MNRRGLLFWLVAAIAAITVLTGVVQIAAPGLVLGLLAADEGAAARHFFGLVGMFMALFGGALLHALFARRSQPVVVLWAGLQKLGAVAGVGLGVWHGVFAPFALGVAGFDLVSAALVFAYLRGLGDRP